MTASRQRPSSARPGSARQRPGSARQRPGTASGERPGSGGVARPTTAQGNSSWSLFAWWLMRVFFLQVTDWGLIAVSACSLWGF